MCLCEKDRKREKVSNRKKIGKERIVKRQEKKSGELCMRERVCE